MDGCMDGWRGLVVRKVICFVVLKCQLNLKNALPREMGPQQRGKVPVLVTLK